MAPEGKPLINSVNGEEARLEGVLPLVAEYKAAVIGLADSVWGEKVSAVVVKKEKNLAEEDVIQFCRDRLAHFKAPKRVFFADELPKTGSAKIYKYRLRQMYKNR